MSIYVNKEPSVHLRSVNIPENVAAIKFATRRNPLRSVKKHAEDYDIRRNSKFGVILHKL